MAVVGWGPFGVGLLAMMVAMIAPWWKDGVDILTERFEGLRR